MPTTDRLLALRTKLRTIISDEIALTDDNSTTMVQLPSATFEDEGIIAEIRAAVSA